MSGGRRVVWVSFSPLERTPRGLTSPMASSRYRITIPATALQRLGWQSSVTFLPPHANRRTVAARFAGAQAVVLGKLTAERESFEAEAARALDLVSQLQQAGVKVFADYCDDHFRDAVRGPYYLALAHAADAVVASTPLLAETLQGVTGRDVATITDPVEGARGEPRAPGGAGRPLRLVWYGHWTNLDTLHIGLPQIEPALARFPATLDILSNPQSGAEEIAAQYRGRWQPLGSSCRFLEWSAAAAWRALAECDAVLIPSDPADPRRAAKSPNRFSEAVWAGRFVIAHPLPAYEALADYGWVGADLGAGLEWACRNREAAAARIAGGQRAIGERFAPDVVARQWMDTIGRALDKA